MNDHTSEKRVPAAASRNKDVILEVLRDVLPGSGRVLEIASGSGLHTMHFAASLPNLQWQPSDIGHENLNSINAWRNDAALDNVNEPIALDVTEDDWQMDADAIVCINMIHIAPWPCCLGLLNGGGRHLPEGGILYLYGPFKVGGHHTAPTNESFDQSLRMQNPDWGVRNLDDVALEARRQGLHLVKTVKMPANNLSVIFRKTDMVSVEE